MCGICGVLTNKMTPEKQTIFQHLMVVSTIRGPYGAGLVSVPALPKEKPEVFRSNLITAAELAYDEDLTKYWRKQSKTPSCIVGHARLPTTGGFGLEDCHPVTGTHVIGVHNGTLDSVNGTAVGKDDHDSRMLFSALDATRTPADVLSRSVGQMAIVWLNKQTGRLWFYRTLGRTLHFATFAGDPGSLFWASEAEALRYVLNRKVAETPRVFSLDPDYMMSFPLRPNGPIKPIDIIKVPKVDPQSKETNPVGNAVYLTVPPVSVRYEELQAILKAGCQNCVQPAHFSDYVNRRIVFYKPHEFMCEACLTYDSIARAYVESEGVTIPAHIPYEGKEQSIH